MIDLIVKYVPYVAWGLLIYTIILFYLDYKKDSTKKPAKK